MSVPSIPTSVLRTAKTHRAPTPAAVEVDTLLHPMADHAMVSHLSVYVCALVDYCSSL